MLVTRVAIMPDKHAVTFVSQHIMSVYVMHA